MSKSIGAFDAKTHLSEYLERVSKGERFTITRRGKPVADLSPHGAERESVGGLLDSMRQFRERVGSSDHSFDVIGAVREDRSR